MSIDRLVDYARIMAFYTCTIIGLLPVYALSVEITRLTGWAWSFPALALAWCGWAWWLGTKGYDWVLRMLKA